MNSRLLGIPGPLRRFWSRLVGVASREGANSGCSGAIEPPAEHEESSPVVGDDQFVPQAGLGLEPYCDSNDQCALHHLIRYQWAVRVLQETGGLNRILDAGCGSGYGSYLLAQALPGTFVTGIDPSPPAVEFAGRTYKASNLEFQIGDTVRWKETIGPTVFDAVVSFDVIEHISHREIMMDNLVRHLSRNGVLLLSTPCGHPDPVLSPPWSHHRIEYSCASLYDFLARYFGRIIRPEMVGFPHLDVFDTLADKGISYLLKLNPVICSEPRLIEKNPYRESSGARS